MTNTFYMVFVEGGNSPTYRHTSEESAEKEAKRLATLTKKKVWVLATVKSFELDFFKIEDCRPLDENGLPF